MFAQLCDQLVGNALEPGEAGAVQTMKGVNFQPGLLRPYLDHRGHNQLVTINVGYKIDQNTGKKVPVQKVVKVDDLPKFGLRCPVANTLSLRKDEWIELDNIVIDTVRPLLGAWSDLMSSRRLSGFNAMGKPILEHQTRNDPGIALVDMDGVAEDQNDESRFKLEAIPLPITHAGFSFTEREMAVSRNDGSPLNFYMAESAARRVAETIEQTTLGTLAGMTYGNSALYGRAPTVYGYLNFPDRITKTDMVAPNGSGTNGPAVLASWLELRELLYAQNMRGPFDVYTSTDWDQYLDNLFSSTEPSAGTLRQNLMKLPDIRSIKRLEYLTPSASHAFTVLMIQRSGPLAPRAIDGMGITTLQWPSKGGLQTNFKIMCIQVPQMFADYNGRCGIAHGRTA